MTQPTAGPGPLPPPGGAQPQSPVPPNGAPQLGQMPAEIQQLPVQAHPMALPGAPSRNKLKIMRLAQVMRRPRRPHVMARAPCATSISAKLSA